MKKLQPLAIAVTLAVSAIGLTGCGDGGSNSHTGSALAQKPPSGTQTILSIGNSTTQSFARVVLVDSSGNTLYSQEFKCDPGASGCKVFIPRKINQTATLFVQNAQGVMVGAYHFKDSLGSYNSVYPDNVTTGMYLEQRLVKEYLAKDKVTAQEAHLRLMAFFKNYKSTEGSADLYEELGAYYSLQASKNSMTENQFLETLSKRLVKWDAATPEELPVPKPQKKRSLTTLSNEAPSGCGAGVEHFLSVTENLGGYFPVVGDFLAGMAGIFGGVCSSTDAKLDYIINQLKTLQASVDKVAASVIAVKERLEFADMLNYKEVVELFSNNVANLGKDYSLFLENNGATSLENYFAAKGWDQGIADGGTELANILKAPKALMAESDELIIVKFNNYLQGLKGKCTGEPHSTGFRNTILHRQFCNEFMMGTLAQVAASQSAAQIIFKDIYKTINKYEMEYAAKHGQPAATIKFKNNFSLPSGVTSFAKADEEISTVFKKSQATILSGYKDTTKSPDGLFNAFAGLPTQLMKNLVERGCAQDGAGRENAPAIIGWYSPTTQDAQDYVVTTCKANTTGNERLMARYFYKAQGADVDANDVANVMGVPVAAKYVTGDYWMFNNSSSSYTHYQYAKDPFTMKPSNDIKFVSVNSMDGGSNESRKSIWVQPGQGSGNVRNGQLRLEDKSLRASMRNGVLTVYNYNWLVFRDSNNFNYAIYMVLGGRYGEDTGYSYMYCMTQDCSVTNNYNLRFKHGPTVDFTSDKGTAIVSQPTKHTY